MKIAFIKVNMMYSKGKDALKPLIFAVIEKLTPPGHELVFYDERIENVPDNLEADVIAFSVETFAAKHAYDLADKYKRENNIIVMGGFHPTAMEEEALEHADIILKGDAEDTWEQLIADLERNRKGESYSDKEGGDSLGKEETGEVLSEKEEGSVGGMKFGNTVKKRIYTSDNKCLMTYVDPNSSCYKGKKYLPLAMIQASRGCKFNCDFCSIKSLYPGTVRQKNIENIVREIKESKEKLVFFIDDNLFLNEESAIELFKAIKPLGLPDQFGNRLP